MTKGLHKDSLRKGDNPHQWMIDDARMELIQQIKAEVERLKEENNNIRCDSNKAYCQGYDDALVDLLASLSTLDLEKPTLQEQPVKIDIRKELASIEFMGVNDARDTETIARHFYELGKQSKPKVCEGLEEEIERFLSNATKMDKGEWKGKYPISEMGFGVVARHFAQWGAEHRSSEIPKDLESYAQTVEDYYDVGEERGYLCTHRGDIKNAVLAGAKWQKEQDTRDMFMSDNRHFEKVYELGKKDMKEQMMENALHGWLDEDNEPPYDLNVLCEEKIPFGKFKHCDKVKIIIVKED